MKRSFPVLLLALLGISACAPLDTLPYTPAQTPETWLQIQPFADFKFGSREVIFVQPSTSIIVYLLGILTIYIGVRFLRTRGGGDQR